MKVKTITVLEAQSTVEAKILSELHDKLYGTRTRFVWSLTCPAPVRGRRNHERGIRVRFLHVRSA